MTTATANMAIELSESDHNRDKLRTIPPDRLKRECDERPARSSCLSSNAGGAVATTGVVKGDEDLGL